MYQHIIESNHSNINTTMVNFPSKKQTSPTSSTTTKSTISNDSNSNINSIYMNSTNNGNTNSDNIKNTNIIDNISVSDRNNVFKSNQINGENRNQNENANVENYRPTYGAYITSILPRGPYLQYKFNDQQKQQQQKSQQKHHPQQHKQDQLEPMIRTHSNENDNNEHFNHYQHPNNQHSSYQLQQTHQNQQHPIQMNPINHHQEHQLDTVSASKDYCSLPYVVNANSVVSNNPLSNYHHAYQIQRPAMPSGISNVTTPSFNENMASKLPGLNGNMTSTSQNMFNSHQAYVTNINVDRKETNQWSPIYYPPQSRAMRSASNPSLQSFNTPPEPTGSAHGNASNVNWHQINAGSNGNQMNICDKILPPKGYQTLPHKLKCGQPGSGLHPGGSHYRHVHPHEDSKSIRGYIRSKSVAATSALAGTSDFLQHIKQQNSNMLARMSTALAKNSGRTLSQQEISYPLGGRAVSTNETVCLTTKYSRSTNALTSQTNCVTLEDMIRLKPGGLNEYEGWALLCQAVQALQDLFLTDTPSTLRILPLVRPSTIQITSRGRVVFIVTATVGTTTLGQLNKFNDMDTSPCHDVTAHLAPEFLSALDKKVAFAESDIEKMWIYSLGITLRKAIRGQQQLRNKDGSLLNNNSPEAAVNSEIMSIAARCAYQNHLHCNQYESNGNGFLVMNKSNSNHTNNNPTLNRNGNSVNGSMYMDTFSTYGTEYGRDGLDITLDQVLGCMCERNIHQRASLMYLLDVISTFCRNEQQIKPFSHIIMELFTQITARNVRDGCDEPVKVSPNLTAMHVDCSRSETDSGRSSAHGDKDSDSNGQYDCQNQVLPIGDLNNYEQTLNQQNLRVIRNRPKENVEYHKYGTIGYAGVKALLMQKKENGGGRTAPALQVVRRNKEGILKRKNSFRRNTIDINLFDLEKARQENFQVEERNDLNKSKSTNCIDQLENEVVGDGLKNVKKDPGKRMEGVSMPDLNLHKITTLPNTRPKNYRLRSFEALTKAYSEDSFWIKPNGPEFIIKSSLPSREIEIVDMKCHNRKVVSVLLLNGQSLHISCNALTTNARQIFEAVIKSENYVENFFIGLCALIGGDFVFLPYDLKIYKVAPQIWVNISKKTNNIDNVFFTLFLRIKFFLPTLRGISSLESRHMLYLQLRKSILEKHILCTDDDLITLGGIALQAEVGDFKESMKYSDYFTISHYLPEGVYQRNKEMAKYLRNSHYCRHGLHSKEAEQNFIKYIQDMKEYGFHLYSAIWTADDSTAIDVYVGISLGGIALFERNRQPQANPFTNSKTSYQRKLYMSFEWLEIENLCFSKHILCIVVRKTESLKAKDNNRIKYKLKMDGRKSYFAFSLASEHHQFYMKLRNSFISLKTLSNKLNIPIASTVTTTTSSHSNVPRSGVFEQQLDRENHNNVAVKWSQQQQDIELDSNKVNCKTDSNNHANIPNSRMTQGPTDNVVGGGISSGIQENIKKIDKQLKASGLRVRNLKKSMLNDNRLMKLKQRFLRRSKSTVGSCTSSEKSLNSEDNRNFVSSNNFPVDEHNDRSNCGRSKEENQNKENECPSKVQQLNDLEPKIYSPNRNRVKMGTRVFSTQFLNKSYDNIYDKTLNLYRFESANSINNDLLDNNLELFKYNQFQKASDDGLSVRSASLNSLYSSEKILNRYSDSPPVNDAYVIHSSINSEKDTNRHSNNFTLPNETISESLMEKFNNMSTNNTVTDRIITKVTVMKERLHKTYNQNQSHHNYQQYLHQNSELNKKNDLIHNGIEIRRGESHTKPPIHGQNLNKIHSSKNSPTRCEPIKYDTLNQNRVNSSRDVDVSNSEKTGDDGGIRGNTEYSKALWHLSRSQESIFINNKFPVRSGCFVVNHHNTNNMNRNNKNNNSKSSNNLDCGPAMLAENDYSHELHEFTLGISIVQGSDNNVYVKDLVKYGPAEKSGIRIGDQIIAVNGISLLNLSYTESLRLLQNTGLIVELQVSQIFNKNVNSSRPSSLAPKTLPLPATTTTPKSQKDNENLVVSCGSKFYSSSKSPSSASSSSVSSSNAKHNYANKEQQNLNSILTNHCDEYLKRLEREHEEIDRRNKQHQQKQQELDNFLYEGGTAKKNKMKVTRRIGGGYHHVEGFGKATVKRIGSFEIGDDSSSIRATRDKFKSLRNVDGNLFTLSPAKSMPDLPKVVAIIPKPDQTANKDEIRKKRIVRSVSQSRKYVGPIRYPVTPIKTVLSPVRHQLSLLADSDDEQVFI